MGKFEKLLDKSGKRLVLCGTQKYKKEDGTMGEIYTLRFKGSKLA